MAERILVDLLGYTGSRGGTETYARELLPRLGTLLPDVRFSALTGRVGSERVRGFFPGRVHPVPWVGGSAASWAAGAVLGTELFARRSGADLIWAPANFGPIFAGVRRVVTVHDAIYDEVPGSAAARLQRASTSWLMARSAQTADLVLTVSAAAGDSIRRVFRLPEDRVRVIHNGSAAPRPTDEPWDAIGGIGIRPGRPIVISTGNRMPHKNFSGLLAALSRIPDRMRPLTVIAGSHLPDPLSGEVRRLGLERDVVLPGWVSAAQLEALYQVADLYVCPSLIEGFGLPVIDALRRSVPVLANDIAVLREVGGPSARYGDATDPVAFSTRLLEALRDGPTVRERAAAREWASTFTWDRTAEATAAALTETLSFGHRP